MTIESANKRAVGSPDREYGDGWLKASAAATAGYAVLLLLLVVIIYFEDHTVLVPLVALGAVGLVLATVIATIRRRWTAWLAAAYALLTLVADGSHQVPAILHPQSVIHLVGAVILIVAGLGSIAIAIKAGVNHQSRVMGPGDEV